MLSEIAQQHEDAGTERTGVLRTGAGERAAHWERSRSLVRTAQITARTGAVALEVWRAAKKWSKSGWPTQRTAAWHVGSACVWPHSGHHRCPSNDAL